MELNQLAAYRAETYKPEGVKSLVGAVRFVNERGFVFFWPIQGVELPSLWVAVAGDRPVASSHRDSGHKTWGWKDRMLGQKRWYYAKVLRRKATMISLEAAPYFYALSENYGEPESDYLEQFQAGRLSPAAKRVYEVLLGEGATHTQKLRRKAGLEPYAFGKALDELQADFKVLPVGVAEAGRWKYAFIYECVHRHHPELLEQARPIGSLEAREHLLTLYFRSVGVALLSDVHKLFGWEPDDTLEALASLRHKGVLVGREDPKPTSAFVLSELAVLD